jgi:hypothetical protein
MTWAHWIPVTGTGMMEERLGGRLYAPTPKDRALEGSMSAAKSSIKRRRITVIVMEHGQHC